MLLSLLGRKCHRHGIEFDFTGVTFTPKGVDVTFSFLRREKFHLQKKHILLIGIENYLLIFRQMRKHNFTL